MTKHKHIVKLTSLGLAILLGLGDYSSLAEAAEERFSNYEIRVIRPRYFSKRKRFELGLVADVVTNQTFVYTYLMSGLLTFHFTETVGLELAAAAGVSIDKEDKKVLDQDFNIKTQIIRTKSVFGGSLLWTPIYGKYQLASGRLIYFDTYLAFGGGSTGVEYKFDHCVRKFGSGAENSEIPVEKVVQYPSFSIGIGQRFFLNRDYSLKWDLRDYMFNASSQDGACKPENEEAQSSLQHNVTMQFGLSRFF